MKVRTCISVVAGALIFLGGAGTSAAALPAASDTDVVTVALLGEAGADSGLTEPTGDGTTDGASDETTDGTVPPAEDGDVPVDSQEDVTWGG